MTLAKSPAIQVARRIVFAASVVVLVCGGLMVALAVAGPQLGLGVDERSIFYQWFGVTRFNLAATGAMIFVFGLYLAALVHVRHPGVLICNTLVPLLLAEILARVIDGQPIFTLRNWLAERNAMLTTEPVNDYDPLLGWVLRPNIRLNSDDPARSTTTGEHGIRLNRPAAGPAPPGAILAVGDSFTYGTDVGDRESWPAHLERLIGSPVINAGVPGYGTDQIALRAETLLPILKPSILVVSFYQHDFDRAGMKVYGGGGKPYFTVENGSAVLHNVPVPIFSGRTNEIPVWLVLPSHLYIVQFATGRLGWSDWWQFVTRSSVSAGNDPAGVSCALARRLQAETAAIQAKLLVVLQYGAVRNSLKPPYAIAVAGCAREMGVDALDLWDDLMNLRATAPDQYRRLWVAYANKTLGHMSAQGNRFVAEHIARKLEKELHREH